MVEIGHDVCSTREAADRLGVSLRTVQLWCEAGLLRRHAGERSRRSPGGIYRVLVVEDELDFRHLFELHLRSWKLPIHLQCVSSGFDALLQIGACRASTASRC